MTADDASPMGLFERWLTLWVGLGIVAGLGLGSLFPGLFATVAALEVANVNLVVALFIWVMIYPMMVSVDFASLKDVGRRPKGLCITLVVNWLVKPFTMAGLGVLFFEVLFADLVDPTTAREYIAGMILLGVAPCTAMVFVWSQLVRGDAKYTLVQVSINDIIMVFAFAP
ncbi:MAG: arsenical-resistance protein, partial [Pseudomonadales bacterium]|nr:arsenical-resistance protein [Pseudomonadales bacterium]